MSARRTAGSSTEMSPRVKWHRAGRGSCEIRSVEIGSLLRVSAHRDASMLGPRRWHTYRNLCGLGIYDDFDAARARCDEELRHEARLFLEDWAQYQKLYPVPFKALAKRE